MTSGTDNQLSITYVGKAGSLFWLAAKTLFFTLLTLGIYRFWMKTRLRRFYWSGTRIGGQPLEYTGKGLEKLLGFLIAVVFLAVYLGILQVLLSFAGMAVFQGGPAALNFSVLLVVPLFYYASYRARRYILSRTRWRGVRFGVEPGAVSYMITALGHLCLTVVTLGFLYPRQVFKLEKFTVDRTRYGSLPLSQEGQWTMLLKPWLVVFGAILLMGGLLTWHVTTLELVPGRPPERPVQTILLAVMTYATVLIGLLYFRVTAFRKMAATKRAGKSVGFESGIRTGKLLGIYSLGGLLVMIATFVLAFVVFFAAVRLSDALGFPVTYWDFDGRILEAGDVNYAALVPVVLSYIVVFLSLALFGQVLISQPVWRHYAEETTVLNAAELDDVVQRAADENVEAEGFADALDVGAAF